MIKAAPLSAHTLVIRSRKPASPNDLADHDAGPLARHLGLARDSWSVLQLFRRPAERLACRSRLLNLFVHLGLEVLEVLGEEASELAGLLVVGVLVVPGAFRIQHLCRDTGDFRWDVQAKDRVLPGLDVGELALYGRSHHLARGSYVYPLAHPVRPAQPAGVNEVAARTVLTHLLGEHGRVRGRRQGQERRPEAGRERRLYLVLHVGLGAGKLGGVAGKEIVGGLLGG